MNNYTQKLYRLSVAALPLMGLMIAVSPATGQPVDGSAEQSDPASANALADIVVTARRKAENLQTAPVSVSAITGDFLGSFNTVGVDKIAQLVPNVAIAQASGSISGNVATIRGIGNQEPLLSVDSPVGLYLDGVYLGRQAANNFELVEPDRVEVLRGPQGTLFGRNTTGGAINIISKTPDRDAGASVKAGYGSFDEWFIRPSVETGELGSTGLTASFAYVHRERHGFVNNPNVSSNKDPGALNSDAAFGKVHGNWGALTIDLTADWSNAKGQRNPFQIVGVYQPAGAYYSQSPDFGGDPFVVAPNIKRRLPTEYMGQQTSKTFGVTPIVAYELSEAMTVKSITSWRGWDSKQPTNYASALRGPVVDFTSPNLFSVQRVSPFVSYKQDLSQRQFSQELQLLGKVGEFSYVGGLYYFNERASEFNTNDFTLVLPPAFLGTLGFPAAIGEALSAQGLGLIGVNLGQTLAYSTVSKSLAGFGQVSWRPEALDSKLELTGGIRYTHDKRSIDQTSIPSAQLLSGPLESDPPTPGPARAAKAQFKNWSYLASLNYQWTPDFMTYARFSTGYKSGGFDARAGLNTLTGVSFPFTFSPEKATAYEIGFKLEALNRRVRLNSSVFYTKYDGLQVSQYSGGNGFIPNADAHYQGFEVELTALPAVGFQIDASFGYTDPVFDDFILADPATGITSDYRKSAHFPYVPKVTAHVGAQYTISLGVPEFVVRADYSRIGKRYSHSTTLLNPLTNVVADPGQDLVSARLSITRVPLASGTLEVGVYGENLLNQSRRMAGIDYGPSIGIAGVNFGSPRSIGVDAKITF